MSSPEYGNFFNAAAALFPILVLTKTVSLRNRSAAVPRQLAKDKDFLYDLRHWIEEQSIVNERRQYLSEGGHILHILCASAGEVIALFGLWGESKGLCTAIAVVVFLVIATIPLVVELLIDAFRA